MRLKTGRTPASRRRRRTSCLGLAGQVSQARVGEAAGLERAPVGGLRRQAMALDLGLGADDVLDLAQEPGLVGAGRLDLLHGQAMAEGLGDDAQAVGGGQAELAHDGRLARRLVLGAVPLSMSISSKPDRPVSRPRSAFCRLSAKVRPMAMTSPTDFIEVVSMGSAPGYFSKAKRGILVTT